MKVAPYYPTPIEFGISDTELCEYERLSEESTRKVVQLSDRKTSIVLCISRLFCVFLFFLLTGSEFLSRFELDYGAGMKIFLLVSIAFLTYFISGTIVGGIVLIVIEGVRRRVSNNRKKDFLSRENRKEKFGQYHEAKVKAHYSSSDFSYYCYLYPGIEKHGYDRDHYVENKVEEIVATLKKEISYLNSQINEKWWFDLSPKEFEDEVALWFGRQGYVSKTTSYVGDGGVDVVVEKQSEKIYVQCKHYNSPVGVSVLRELFGVVKSDKVSGGILVCLVNPTKGAQEFAQNNGIGIITAKELASKSASISNIDTGVRYVNVNKVIGKEEPYAYVGPLGLIFDLFHYEKDAKSLAQRMAKRGYYSTILYADGLYYVIVSKDSVLTKTRLFQRFGCYPSHAVVSD